MTRDDDLVLAVNAGSSSLKLAAFRRDTAGEPRAALRVAVDRRADAVPRATGDDALVAACAGLPAGDDAATVAALLGRLPAGAVVHRVVHGGDETRECVALDAAQRERLRALAPLAPLHQPPALAIVDAVAATFPSLPQHAGLDTAFHATMPPEARGYALPTAIRVRHPEIRAYGFHGLSCRSAIGLLRRDGDLPSRLVVAHLGSGASVTAIRDGRSIATSMGFSALDGLPMATRPGRLDPGVLLYLLRAERLDADGLERLLYRESGLAGLSGLSADLRVLLASEASGARDAVDFFVYRAALEIGALAVALGGIDCLVFTGGIGEHQPEIRDRIVGRLRPLLPMRDVRVLPCDEEAVMANAVYAAR